ncbi:MAG TPA: redox-sensitive transcriptional activator SoxR [Ideonella sp.]|uniref:redox-sensitive transcriptional activator SoxR n=1 Tax=Ideonella sp. TaxID=1929293 RepID=UPI002BF16FC6|nr:redox-sensitive transcriptional activator SoxR [Ideonella sp.]HSI47752.1 redox-sensitive transcriptional activator SoxR [Ideonella sp.]
MSESIRFSASSPLTIGELAQRAGVAPSAVRFYEAEGLMRSQRSPAGHRRYPRSELRRIAFIRAAQSIGLTLEQIRAALATLPEHRTPTKADWEKLSRDWRALLDARIAEMTRLRDQLTSCIGCGCLSLKSCGLYNTGDTAAAKGQGARYLLGDRPPPPANAPRR